MNKTYSSVLVLCCVALTTTGLSNNTAEASTVPTLFCPAADQLKKDALTQAWHAGPEYKSDTQSFVNHIDRFVGARWSGIEVGQIACVYAGVEEGSFPVMLYYNKLVMQPERGLWGKDQGGYSDCKAVDPKDCPYQPRIKKEVHDIYQDVLNISKTNP